MKTPKDTPRHQTFLVRAWLERTSQDNELCRFRVQNVRTAEWHSFTDIASLVTYFQNSLEERSTPKEDNIARQDEQPDT